MGFWSGIFSSSVVKDAADGLDDLFTSDEERLKFLPILKKLDADIALGQIEINKIEAAKPGIFNGWRPAIGWTCAISLMLVFIMQIVAIPIITFVSTGKFPPIETSILFELIFALLGMSGLRTWEKTKGIAK